ncbi:hypothetical protein GCM10011380_18100 [Sphingomonas metalli]|uniref:Acyltransferase 3 domain-containing protein n=1 Tax=Sphingomonas metalli TaxID=1779358 RepID=A0A916T267_9SPHN|nr:acyltransferase [Sphingomonas metalli]GGB28887.1 hypothetical protein GCM10011380_18100 [Sphingomonas metalli]
MTHIAGDGTDYSTRSVDRRSTPRIEIIDALRGCALLLVVFDHSCGFGLMAVPAPYRAMGAVLTALRMPTLFLLSGFVCASLVREPLRALNRAISLAWLCAIWLPLALALHLGLIINVEISPASFLPLELAREALHPSTHLWFIWVLCIYTILTPLIRGRDRRRVLVAAGLISFVSCLGLIEIHPSQNNILRFSVFYFAGALYADRLRAMLGTPVSTRLLLMAIAAFCVILALHFAASRSTDLRLMGLAVRIAGCVVALNIGRALFAGRDAPWLCWIGRNTLPVYLLHMFFIIMLTRYVFPTRAGAEAYLLLPLIAALSVAGSLAVHRATATRWTAWLFRCPDRLHVAARRYERPEPA